MSRVSTVYPRLDDAISIVESEIASFETEIDAFESLLARIRRLEPRETTTPARRRSVRSNSLHVEGVDPEAVRRAYRQTVLSMDHYETTYGEPLLENVTLELGSAVRELFDGGDPISTMHVGVIETATEQAKTERVRFHTILREELDSLRSVQDGLADVERRFYIVTRHTAESRSSSANQSTTTDQILELLAECHAVSVTRQQTIHGRAFPSISGLDETSLIEYLYGTTPYRFPGLLEIADVAGRIESQLERSCSRY